ncbi:MAG: hypothetical protein KY439_11495, partial [Actinobacteria bacterium]|nr:hypothetical protein [Actinomycetota bacterium]
RYDAVGAEQGRRQAWLEAHADTLAYRDQLAEAVTKRRRDLGVAAAITQPDHVLDLIGAVPTDNPAALVHWTNMAGRIEAYREEWGVPPEQMRERPLDACQAREWDVSVNTSEMLARPSAPALDRGVDHGIELGL